MKERRKNPKRTKRYFRIDFQSREKIHQKKELKESKVILLISENQCDGKYTNI